MAANISGNIGSYEFAKVEKVFASTHEPVILTMLVKPGQGTLERGTIVAKDGDGAVVPYNPSASDTTAVPVGVLVEDVDTDKETTANVLVHGVVFRERLKVAGGTVSATDLDRLSNIAIWNIG